MRFLGFLEVGFDLSFMKKKISFSFAKTFVRSNAVGLNTLACIATSPAADLRRAERESAACLQTCSSPLDGWVT
jgi:hypothetical protein